MFTGSPERLGGVGDGHLRPHDQLESLTLVPRQLSEHRPDGPHPLLILQLLRHGLGMVGSALEMQAASYRSVPSPVGARGVGALTRRDGEEVGKGRMARETRYRSATSTSPDREKVAAVTSPAICHDPDRRKAKL